MKNDIFLYTVTGIHRGGGKREDLSFPCSRLKAVELRDWARKIFAGVDVYHDIQIRECKRV